MSHTCNFKCSSIYIKKKHEINFKNIQQCFFVMLMKTKILVPGRATVWSLHVLPISARVFSGDSGFPLLPKDVHIRLIDISVLSQSEWVWVSVSVTCSGRVSCPWWGLPCTLSCQGRLWTANTLNWNNWVRKSLSCFYYFFLNISTGHIYFSV